MLLTGDLVSNHSVSNNTYSYTTHSHCQRLILAWYQYMQTNYFLKWSSHKRAIPKVIIWDLFEEKKKSFLLYRGKWGIKNITFQCVSDPKWSSITKILKKVILSKRIGAPALRFQSPSSVSLLGPVVGSLTNWLSNQFPPHIWAESQRALRSKSWVSRHSGVHLSQGQTTANVS